LWVSSAENNTTNPDTGGAGWVSLAFEGLQSVAVVSNTATLTQLQSAYPIITLTGTLTANATVNVPAQVGEWIFSNQTTGAFTLTVKTPSGTGVTIAPSSSQYCWGDGTNIYYANASSVTSFNTRTGAITLNSTDVTDALGFTPLQYGLGVNQSYVNYTSSGRTLNTIYTNTTGKPIYIECTISDLSSNTLTLLVNGIVADYFTDNGGFVQNVRVSGIIPATQTYQVVLSSGSTTIVNWSELR